MSFLRKAFSKEASERLIAAAEAASVDEMAAALKSGANIDYKDGMGATALMIVVQEDNAAPVALLLGRGADLALSNNFGQTALHLGLRAGVGRGIPQSLIEAGAPLNGRDMHGATPAFYAAQTGNAGIVALLGAKAADLKTPNKHGTTPLMMAARHPEAVDALLEHDCGVDAQDENGSTALMQAALMGDKSLVEKLLHAGANIYLKDNRGETALAIARGRSREDAVALLEQAAAAHVAPCHAGLPTGVRVMNRLSLARKAACP